MDCAVPVSAARWTITSAADRAFSKALVFVTSARVRVILENTYLIVRNHV